MKVTLETDILAKLSPRGILTYVAIGICGLPSTTVQLAAAIRVDEKIIQDGLKNIGPLQILEMKSTPKKRAAKAKDRVAFVLPEFIDEEAWRCYEEMRKRIGKPMTDPARELAVRKLRELESKGHISVAVLNQSTFNGWQGLFPLRHDDARVIRPGGLKETQFKM